ncbi:FtsX-like permease family protein [Clostridium saccharobutylicum]|uniref:FtsX-like permease family protein n=1 Tax=Clostridium saccharobutylicum TaxID=169679 RepID=A0A1S8NDU3_CLOSA|nr:FtsX-like permease family protein [Clostridium saccharobutylicum]OOM14600.1 FtsX-like permease family protein [Clostridium saccharobutylicum]
MSFFKNNNSAIIRKLTIKTLKANKLRNIFAIIAITLTTLLFTSIFTIGIGITKSFEQETMRQSGGSAHVTFKYLNENELDKIKVHPLIKEFGYSIMVSKGENSELLKHHTEIRYETDKMAQMSFCYPTAGKMPQKENEIVTSTKVLDLLGVSHEIGQKLKIEYNIQGEKRSQEFVLSGFYESDDASNFSMILVSKSFIDKELVNIDFKNTKFTSQDTGFINLDVMLKNSISIQEDLDTILNECGYSNNKGAENYIATGVNWAYMSSNFNSEIIIPILGAILLIILTGYLIIYNIFQISVIKDIRSYGLLKTIGTTPKQIKKLITNQAFLLSFIGIPIGLILGFLIGNILLPIIMSTTTIKKAYIPFNPIIFIGASLFSLITVYISCKRPGKIAASVSPVEATKYNEVKIKSKKKIKKFSQGISVYNMAFCNVLRNKKKTIIVIISMSLSLILLNSVYTFIKGFDMDKYLSKYIVSDFIVGSANYFNNQKLFKSESDTVSEETINTINNLDYIKSGGRIYFNLGKDKVSFNDVKRTAQVYGLDDFPMSQLKVVEGNIDLEKLKSGKYILENVQTNDYGNYETKSAPFDVGQRVTLSLGNYGNKEYEVMAKIEMKNNMTARYYSYEVGEGYPVRMILPSSEFCNIVEKTLTMIYMFNVHKNNLDEAERFIENYTNNIEYNMNYESKQVYINGFKSVQNMFLIVGATLSIIIGVIGILNFINAILTSIISRQMEFAILQSIGMTTKQLKNMLNFEGVFYAVSTILVSVIIGSIVSITIVSSISREIWFCKYEFTILPLLIIVPILLILGVIVPSISYKATSRKSVVERLRKLE